MIRLHCTKTLLAKLPLSDTSRLRYKRPSLYAANDANQESPLSGWHAKLLVLQRRQCLLLVHDATRFPVFIPALKKANLAELDYFFSNAFMNTLLKCGADDALMQRAQTMLGPLVCDSVCDRSVQGTMNQMGQDLDFALDYDGVKVHEITGYRQGAWLADRPCRVKTQKDCIWPRDAMFALLR
jgi:hypothetical protein